MQIHWFTRREMTDLCSTTQREIASGLCRRGHSLTIINPDEEGTHELFPWQHVSLPIRSIRGFQARKLGRNMKKYLSCGASQDFDLAIVDWQVAPFIIHELERQSVRWMLMDRSPPADKGILASLQWPSWKRAWKMVRANPCAIGCVVSKAHREFVLNEITSTTNQIIILNAGANMELFAPAEKNPKLTLVYHGRLDRNRGVMALPMFVQKANAAGIECHLMMIGEGDAYRDLTDMQEVNNLFEVIPTMSPVHLAQVLSRCHIGLLPMPATKVWKLASPLKMAEYAASGLLILGIDHTGHRVKEGPQPDWIKLIKKESFHEVGIEWLKSLENEDLIKLSKQARNHAQKSMNWETSLDVLEDAM